MNAETIAKALGGHKAGAAWMACCPAHEDREPSLSITNARGGKVLVCCHAGCDQRDVIAALRSRAAWETAGRQEGRFPRTVHRRLPDDPDPDALKRTEAALAIWQSAVPADGTPVETYLRSRGLNKPPPSSLRFHAGLKHPKGGIWPVMVALITRGTDDTPLAVHRTFLSRDGAGKAPVEPQKMMLGPCRGGTVRLRSLEYGSILISEGIETGLAAMRAVDKPVWAALSTSGMKTLGLPPHIKDVTILADGDNPGEAAARDAALRWKREGRRVRVARPPQGMDFNDLLMGSAPRVEESGQ
jgi:putative DNA primase/helicase